MQDIDVNAWMGASLAAQTCWLRHNHHGCSKLIWPQKYSDQNSVLMFHAHDAFYYICFSSKHMLELWSVPLQSANEVCPSVPSGFLSWCQSCSWYMGRQLTEILILQHRLKNQWLRYLFKNRVNPSLGWVTNSALAVWRHVYTCN